MSRPSLRVHCDGYRYHLRWFDDSGRWREILDDFKYEFMPHERKFDPDARTWSVPLYCGARVRAWGLRWFSREDCEFTEDEPAGHGYGSRSYSNSHSGYGRYGQSQSATTAVERAYAQLHLLPSAPPELARAAHKLMVRLSHPDAGGSHDAAVAVNLAWEAIEADQERKRMSA